MIYKIFFWIAILAAPMNFFLLEANELNAPLLEEVPVAYKGRIRPLDAMARLWLEDNYHRQSIKSNQYNDFHIGGPSALALLWKIQFTGHHNWIDIPLFWVNSVQLKDLLELPLRENYFSYQQLNNSIYANQKTNLALLKELITYHFLKAYYDSANRSGSLKLELAQLSPGLWAAWQNNQLQITNTPVATPWHNLKPGFVITDQMEKLTPEGLKQQRSLNDEISSLLLALNQFSLLKGPYAADEKDYENVYQELRERRASPAQTAEFLDQEYPLNTRLANAGPLFKVLPAKNGEWISLNALTIKVYDSKTETLQRVPNFTIYPNNQFEKIRDTYFKLINDYDVNEYKQELAALLINNYEMLAKTPITKAWEKSLTYPSLTQLKIENWYYQLPISETSIGIYAIAIILLSLGLNQKKRFFTQAGTFFVLVAFSLNTLILAIRCFILQRPPVSNMFETVIYVPWIAVLTSLLLSTRIKNSILLLSASLVSLILLVLLRVTGLGGSLENVQAVLDSQFWLTIHVLMIVGSYGVFALAGILGHIYLFKFIIHEQETFSMYEIGKALLQALYIGVALLIPGTILGGVWAAQSWGRFWDWDPKESWAFISSCIYLLFIHAYTFKYIRYFGLAMGAVLGFLTISFTWYGVNYILGTGLHSYGFGSGGEIYYYLFILAELLFLAFTGIFYLKLNLLSRKL
jgi:ABC-type transport system involved in cytochrome c biogenesis permease subunit